MVALVGPVRLRERASGSGCAEPLSRSAHRRRREPRRGLPVDDLLRYARAGASAVRSEPVDLGAVTADVLHTLAPAIDESGARITVHALPTVMADESLLRQVLQNLIANAVTFSRDGQAPRVDVSAVRLARSWEISVADFRFILPDPGTPA